MEDNDNLEMPALQVLLDSEDNSDGDIDSKDMPELQPVFDSDDGGDDNNEGSIWFTDVEEEAGNPRSYLGLTGVRLAHSSMLTWT